MKNKKIIFLWIIWIGLTGIFLYCVKESSLRLFLLDAKNGFQYIPETRFKIMMILITFLLISLVCWSVSKKGVLALSWKIFVGRRQIEIHTYKLPYVHFALLICVSFLMVLGSVFMRDALESKACGRFENILIAHALGGIDGKAYTNSKEALLYNYNLGHRAFEVDFSITSDEKLVCAHDWEHVAYIQGREGETEVLSKEEFESGCIYEKYTPISIQELLIFMSEHEDVWIITDSKQSAESLVTLEFAYIVDMARELGIEHVLDRIVVQIYHKEMYKVVRNVYEFPCIIFTLYKYWDGNAGTFPDICRFCIYNDIKFITMWDYLATPEVMEIAEQYGIKVYVHTVNDMELVGELEKIGVTGFYTDFLIPGELEEI